jgi:quercetin dioxygenase-like cupin family protein
MGAQAPQVIGLSQGQVGSGGQIYLARGVHVAMRYWEESPGNSDELHVNKYETVGYVIVGKMRLTIEGESAEVAAGQSWLVPACAKHSYTILEPLKAIEATSPPSLEWDLARSNPSQVKVTPGLDP